VLELLGVGVPRPEGGWLLHRLCARSERPGLVAVVSQRPDERKSLLDVIGGHAIATEGRVWVDGVPSMRGTSSRLRQLVAEVDLPPLLAHHRSVLWNVLRTGRAGYGCSVRSSGFRAWRVARQRYGLFTSSSWKGASRTSRPRWIRRRPRARRWRGHCSPDRATS